MSGYKHATVTISQEEYRRLQETAVKKKFKEFSKLNTCDPNREQDLLNVIGQLEERERLLQNQLSSIEQPADQWDESALQAILDQNAACYSNLATSIKNSNSSLQDDLIYMTEEFSRALDQQRESYYLNIQSIFRDQDEYHSRENAKNESAFVWFNRCLILADFIQNQFDHERFTPGKFIKILRNLNLAENNLTNGFFEASLQSSQQIYLDLADLNFELEQELIQWQTRFDRTYLAINEFISQMEANAFVAAVGLKGEELPNQVELNYWTNDKYNELLNHCRQLAIYMIQDQNILSLDDIDRIYLQIIPVIQESFESLILDARLNALNSQLRMNIAEKALNALENHGFLLDTAGYKDDDMRSEFNAHLECPDGSEVSIQVIPTEIPAGELSNDLVVITTHPYLKTEHEARLQWDELSHTLSQYNLKVSNPKIHPMPLPEESDQSAHSRIHNQISAQSVS
jgi:hypothetical protein